MIGRAPSLKLALFASVLLSPMPGQEYVRWVRDLGDEEKSEAAERLLVEMGAKALRPLAEQIQKWDTSTARDRARCRAVLRVVALLGKDAASLAPSIKRWGLEAPCPLLVEIADTLATLEPYAGDEEWHELFHRHMASFDGDKAAAMRAFIRTVSRQTHFSGDSFEDLKEEITRDRFGTREVAAEWLARSGHKEAIGLLRARLLDRKTKPKGADQLRHNGWPVPIEDDFRFRAGNALVALAPSDPRAAIGYAHRALHHPHRRSRLASLRQMAQLGPAAADAIPELMRIALLPDAEMSFEALKLLGMAGKDVGAHLVAIERLAANGDGPGARVAGSLAARLRAMGCEPTAVNLEAQAEQATLAALGQALDDSPSAEVLDKVAATKAMWPLLVARFRKGGAETSDVIFDLIARNGWLRSEEERTEVRRCLVLVNGQCWQASMMSSSASGVGLGEIHFTTYARLMVDPASDAEALVALLDDANPFVREVAIARLGRTASEWQKGRDDYADVHSALLSAAVSKHPSKFDVEEGPNTTQEQTADRSREIQTAAAVALAGCAVPSGKAVALLEAVVRSDNEQAIAQALGSWMIRGSESEAVAKELKELVADKREAVSTAASNALLRLGFK